MHFHPCPTLNPNPNTGAYPKNNPNLLTLTSNLSLNPIKTPTQIKANLEDDKPAPNLKKKAKSAERRWTKEEDKRLVAANDEREKRGSTWNMASSMFNKDKDETEHRTESAMKGRFKSLRRKTV